MTINIIPTNSLIIVVDSDRLYGDNHCQHLQAKQYLNSIKSVQLRLAFNPFTTAMTYMSWI